MEQLVTITFKTERSLWIETSKSREDHDAATAENPQPPYQLLLWNDCNRAGNSRLQLCDPGCHSLMESCQNKCFHQKCPFWCISISTKINGQIILHQLQLTENPSMKVLALTSPFNAVNMIYVFKLRRQVSTSVSLYPFQQHISNVLFTVRRT